MEQLKSMKQCLMAQVQAQMGNLAAVDTEELGEAVDMIKDLSEAIYYCTITEAMEQKDYRDMDREDYGRMYYSSTPRSRMYDEREATMPMRDSREGRSPMSRKMYIESKEMHQDQAKKMKELENYMQELSMDITEMIEDATPEEKIMLQNKLNTLATKVGKFND